MRLVDFIPYVLFALKTNKATKQRELTHFIGGESGINSPRFTRTLFPEMQSRGLIASTTIGRSTLFRITDRGLEHYAANPLTPEDEVWMANFMKDVIANPV